MLCGICLEELYLTEEYCIMTKCSHYYHSICILRWLNIRNECPLCRTSIWLIDCITLNASLLLNKEHGIILNHYNMFPQTLLDLKLCILFVFFVQHGIIFQDIPNYIHKHICQIIAKFIEHILHHHDGDFNYILYNFYRHYHLHLNFSSTLSADCKRLSMNDLHLLFFGRLILPLLE